jgi:hypothetical protein
MAAMPEDIEGGCLCGAVRFALTLPTKWCAHCHCSMCRRAHGAVYVTFVGVPASRFRILQGEEAMHRYPSSPEAVRTFCRDCGSTMLFEGSRWPDEVHVARACIDGPIDREPQAHVYFDDRADWLDLDADLPRLGGPNGNTPIPR